jgi:tRNA(Ile)-lysidine synthase
MLEPLPDRVRHFIRERGLFRAGDRLLVAVSGGADSVALLRVLLELRAGMGIVIAAAHFNHGMREASVADAAFVEDLARRHDLQFFAEREDVAAYALANRLSVEAAGRSLRYEWLAKVAGEHKFDAVATAHTLDDQAETVLMKFLRGAGTRGLGGVYPRVDAGAFRIIRPLLSVARAEVEAYLTSIDQPWQEDETNRDRRFRRNRVRHELLPLLMREYNPNLRQVLGDTGEINRAEEEDWKGRTRELLAQTRVAPDRINVSGFPGLSVARQRRLLKLWLEESGVAGDFQHIEALRRCSLGEQPGAKVSGDWQVSRMDDCIVLEESGLAVPIAEYRYTLPLPGEVEIRETACLLRAVPVPAPFAAELGPGTLIRADLLGPELVVRNWRPGDRYHPAHSSSEQKLKRLFADRHIPAGQRPSWPVAVKDDDIVWARDLPVAAAYCWRPGDGDAIRIECLTLSL